jgi:Holliday junction resolvase RusA-like endonuclease
LISFTIPVAPVTKKNGSQIIYNPKLKRPMVIPKKQYLKYEKDCAQYLKIDKPIDYPINLKCVFYVATKRRVDLVNLLEAICDILVKYNILTDDNCNVIVSHDGSRVYHDKDNPRTIVEISEVQNASF